MPKPEINTPNTLENISINKRGVVATLFLPFFIAFIITSSLIFGLPTLLKETSNSDINIPESNQDLKIIAGMSIFSIPMALAFTWGMVFSVKRVSMNLDAIAKYKTIKFRTVFGSWLSALTIVHLAYTGFYVLISLIWIIFKIISSFYTKNPEALSLVETFGPIGNAGASILLSIGLGAYIFLFSLMGYLFVTLPLVLISAVLFKVFAIRTPSHL